MKDCACVILAAGEGTRMKSARPKVLHTVLGRPMIAHVVDAASRLKASPVIVVTGHGRDEVEALLSSRYGRKVTTVLQKEQKGTAHAVMQAMSALKNHKGDVFILYGDVPLIDPADLKKMRNGRKKKAAAVAFLTMTLPEPGSYGRVIRDDDGRVHSIVEAKDCTSAQRRIREVNSGIYCIEADFLRKNLKNIGRTNKKKEFYLTDLVEIAARTEGVIAIEADAHNLEGINDRVQLALLEQRAQERLNAGLMRKGVTIRNPASVFIEPDVKISRDVEIMQSVHLSGTTKIKSGAIVGAGCAITDSVIGRNVEIKPYSVIEEAVVEDDAVVGPFARLRPGTLLKKGSKVGNYVELKKTVLGEGSKANHLSYLGDGVIGRGVNVGAGTIFCNYDGFSKHRTVLEDEVFIGSDSQIVAPVTVGKGSYVGTGTTLTRDVPPGSVALSRVRQVNREGFARLLKNQLASSKKKKK